MLRPPHSPWLDLPNDIWGCVQTLKSWRQKAPLKRRLLSTRLHQFPIRQPSTAE
jgi:hypothetical protein